MMNRARSILLGSLIGLSQLMLGAKEAKPSPYLEDQDALIGRDIVLIQEPVHTHHHHHHADEFPLPQHVTLRHREFGGVGTETGYSSLDGFYASEENDGTLFFGEVRAHMMNHGRLGLNAGGGFRRCGSNSHVWGGNIFYDYRSGHEYGFYHDRFHQVGIGGELFVDNWDFRVNGYLPLGNTR